MNNSVSTTNTTESTPSPSKPIRTSSISSFSSTSCKSDDEYQENDTQNNTENNPMDVYIINRFGDKQLLKNIKPSNTINFIKFKYGMNKDIIITYNNIELDGTKTFQHYSITSSSILKIPVTFSLIIKHPSEKPKLLHIQPTSTISELRDKISNIYALQWPFKLCMNYKINSKTLDHPQCTLTDYGIHDQQCLYILFAMGTNSWQQTTFTIKTLTGKTVKIEGMKPKDTVLTLKLKIQHEMRIYHDTQRLIYAGKQLQDELTMMQENIGEQATIHLVLRLSSYVYKFNDLLCDGDIKPIKSGMSDDDIYYHMIFKWNMSCRLDTVHLKMEQVYKIEQNFAANMSVYEALMSTKKKRGKEEMLFHGTSLENMKKIIHGGFNRDYNIKSLYGKGTYFSNKARIAAEYCTKFDEKNFFAMLACKTYVGESTVGRLMMGRNELYMDDKVTQYDSLVNDLDDASIFVINRDYHSVPCFIIVFTVRSNDN